LGNTFNYLLRFAYEIKTAMQLLKYDCLAYYNINKSYPILKSN